MKLVWVMRCKLLFDGEGTKPLIVEELNLLGKIYLVGDISKLWLLAGILPHSQCFPHVYRGFP